MPPENLYLITEFSFLDLMLNDIESYCFSNNLNYITLYPVNERISG